MIGTPKSALLPWVLLLSISCASGVPEEPASSAPQQSAAEKRDWPREYEENGARLVLYQPQIERWDRHDEVEARIALALTLPDAATPTYGAFQIRAHTETDLGARMVKFTDLEIVGGDFPTLNLEQRGKLMTYLEGLIPKDAVIEPLDLILANLERSASVQQRSLELVTTPPKIFASLTRCILVLFDGEPIWSPIKDSDLRYAVNTNWDIFKAPGDGGFYLRDEDAWLHALEVGGPWLFAGDLPRSFGKLPTKGGWQPVLDSLPGRVLSPYEVPAVFTSEVPAELIYVDGEPSLSPIGDSGVFWVTNTESDLFVAGEDSHYYYLVSGRWFRARSLQGPWAFATHELPEGFLQIPPEHARGEVLPSVPGSPQAQEAVLLAQIPQKATIQIAEAGAEVNVYWVGEPEFAPIEGTGLFYGTNTQSDVVKVGDLYFLCFQGVWFRAPWYHGPWEVARRVPEEIYTIPPSSPVFYVTYVRVYDSDRDTVTVGSTSGYSNVHFHFGVVVYGTGYYYPRYSYWGTYYYPRYWGYPYSYGSRAYYNPYTGTYGRGAVVYGPYGGIGRGAVYNPRTGTYARGGTAWGPYQKRSWAAAYNPRTGTGALRRSGSDIYSSWGRTAIKRGDDWARAGHYSDSRGTVAGYRTSEGAGGVIVRGEEGAGFIHRDSDNNVYAGKDGQVYKREDGGWKKYENGGWSPVEGGGVEGRLKERGGGRSADRTNRADRSTLGQLERERGARQQGAGRSAAHQSWQRSGAAGSRAGRGSLGGRGYGGGGGARPAVRR